MTSLAPISRVAIIGGGIGGLALAQFLAASDAGFNVVVFDRDETQGGRDQGYYLGINHASVQVFDARLPLHDDIQSVMHDPSNKTRMFSMRNTSDKPLMEVAANGVFVDRTRFRNALLAKNRFSVIWNKRFVKYEERSSGVVIHFADGSVSEEFDLVVGADGANSVFRKQYVQPAAAGLPRPFEYSDLGFTNIAGMLPASSPSVADSIRALTKPGLVRWLGQDGHTVMMFQFVDSLTSESVLLWVLSFPGKAEDWKGRFTHPDDVTMEEYSQSLHFREQLLEWSASHVVQGAFSETVLRVIKGTPADSRLYGPRQIYSLPSECIKPALLTGQKFPTSERLRRVFILGDAAHATTTHRGLGANTAIADAADLCDAFCRANDRIAAGASLETVNQGLLQEYDEKMVQRATKVAEGSLQSTQMIHATGFFATWIRPFMLGVFHYMFRMFPSMAQQ